MSKQWSSAADLISLLRERGEARRVVKLAPDTALIIALLLENRRETKPNRFTVDMFSDGSTIYRLDHNDDVFQIDGWARSSRVGRAAFHALTEAYPDERFSQRRGSWVEADWPKR